jgi:hypothetical protein
MAATRPKRASQATNTVTDCPHMLLDDVSQNSRAEKLCVSS